MLNVGRRSFLVGIVSLAAIFLLVGLLFAAYHYLGESGKYLPEQAGISSTDLANNTVNDVANATNNNNNKRTFVGSGECASCHQEQYQNWQQSHHRHAFADADSNSVQGDFSAVSVEYTDGIAVFDTQPRSGNGGDSEGEGESKSKSPAYQITLTTNDQMQVYPVRYTLGHYPLQQYLLETTPGNLQVFALAWDARPKADGGQRWMELQAGESASEDNPFHWRHYFQNWNSQCASCHSTDFAKGYQLAADGQAATFNSSWSETGVTCESCHGPASQHINWANLDDAAQLKKADKGLLRKFDKAPSWQFKEGQAIASADPLATTKKHSALDSCASCHSLRHPLSAAAYDTVNSAWENHFDPSLVQEPLYFADGQIREEVFVYGSFSQSKMHNAGVSCMNCHDVHSGQVKDFDGQNIARQENDAVCSQCHRADVFAVSSHHHHPIESEAARCVTCHMPERTYMQVDPRRDHSFQRPSPALSQLAGTPNVCTDCHNDQSNQWAAANIDSWHKADNKPERLMDFADWQLQSLQLNTRLQAVPANQTSANKASDPQQSLSAEISESEQQRYRLLEAKQTPAMKKVMLLGSMPISNAQAYQAVIARLSDKTVVVRLAAIERLSVFDASAREDLLTPLLDDPIKSVRLAATLGLADLLDNGFKQRLLLKQRVGQFIATYQKHEDLLASQLKLAAIYRYTGRLSLAAQSYQKALKLVPNFVPAMVNLADIYRLQQQDNNAEQILLDAISAASQAARFILREQSSPTDGTEARGDSAYTSALAQQATAEYALGLLYARVKNYQLASKHLQSASVLDPQNGQYFYGYLLTLDALGQRLAAIKLLQASPLTAGNDQLGQLLVAWR